VGVFKGIGEFEGKPRSLEKLCEWVVWVSISPLYVLLGGNIMWRRTIMCLLMILILSWDM
jgi:hypothetical protein